MAWSIGSPLDDLAVRRDDERRVVRDARDRAFDGPDQYAEDQQQQDQVQEFPQQVEAAEDVSKDLPDHVAATAGQTFSSMRAALPDRSRR